MSELPGEAERAAAIGAAQQPHPPCPPMEDGEVLTLLSFEWDVAADLPLDRYGPARLVTTALAATARTQRIERGSGVWLLHSRLWHLLRVGDGFRWLVDRTTVEEVAR